MSETSKTCLRCIINGELFDFNEDLGAVAIGNQAACTACMDKLFNVALTLHPNAERPQTASKKRKKHDPFRHKIIRT